MNEKMPASGSRLSWALGRTDIFALGFGTMVGWAWIVVVPGWISSAGFAGTLIAYGVGVAVIFLIGLAYSELSAALPRSGGEMVFAYRALGLPFGWVTGWMMVLAYLSVAIWEGIAFATALDYLLPIPDWVYLWDAAGEPVYLSWVLTAAGGGLLMMLLNLFGTRPATIFQIMATIVILLIAFLFFFGGVSLGSLSNIGPALTNPRGCFFVMITIPPMFVGFDIIPQLSGEMNVSRRRIGGMTLMCIAFSACWYLMVIIGTALGAPAEVRTGGSTPAADAMAYLFGNDRFAEVLIVIGLLGVLTSWNGFFMGATRLLRAMGQARMLPSIFGYTGRRFRTPWAATLIVGGLCMAAPLLGEKVLEWMIGVNTVSTMFTYCCVTLSLVILRLREPGLARPFRIGRGLGAPLVICGVTLLYAVIYIIYALTGGEYSEAVFGIILWFLFGLFLFLPGLPAQTRISPEERERLIFGEEFARMPQRKETRR